MESNGARLAPAAAANPRAAPPKTALRNGRALSAEVASSLGMATPPWPGAGSLIWAESGIWSTGPDG
ncbi:MAG: hypothetical protein AAF961_03540, partial [Planctomycetota bacterium]